MNCHEVLVDKDQSEENMEPISGSSVADFVTSSATNNDFQEAVHSNWNGYNWNSYRRVTFGFCFC